MAVLKILYKIDKKVNFLHWFSIEYFLEQLFLFFYCVTFSNLHENNNWKISVKNLKTVVIIQFPKKNCESIE